MNVHYAIETLTGYLSDETANNSEAVDLAEALAEYLEASQNLLNKKELLERAIQTFKKSNTRTRPVPNSSIISKIDPDRKWARRITVESNPYISKDQFYEMLAIKKVATPSKFWDDENAVREWLMAKGIVVDELGSN